MRRFIQYRVIRGKNGWYFETIAANGKIVTPSEGYTEARGPHKTIAAIWFGSAKAMHHPDAYMTKREFLLAHPIPYSKDSLLP